MRFLYRYVCLFSLLALFFISSVTIATTKSDYVAAILSDEASGWEVTITEKKGTRLTHIEPSTIKPLLIDFLRDNNRQEYREIGYAQIGLLICIAFSLVGWYRESKLTSKIRTEQDAAHQALSRPDVKNQHDFKH